MFREFKFAMYTPYNRACFVKNFYEAYNYIGFKGGILPVHFDKCLISHQIEKLFFLAKDLFSIKEYHSLALLLCNDFPLSMLENCERYKLCRTVFVFEIIISTLNLFFRPFDQEL
jgi:hypothetical protein